MFEFTHHPENPLILGPMAGFSDRPFRLLAHENGAGLVCMEMVSANAIKYGNKKTAEMIRIDAAEHPVSLQLFGPDPETMALAAATVSRFDYDVLDINMGCPMPKITGNGEGSALMRDPALCGRIVKAVREAQDRPVTVKIRSGYSGSAINAAEVALACEEAGAAAVAVHGRTREQLYMGRADWSVIRSVAEAVKIPVIGSGDVCTPADAERMLRETGCAYVMIARAARGNPWLFAACRAFLAENGLAAIPSPEEAGSAGAEGSIYREKWLLKDPGKAPRPPVGILVETMRRHLRMQVEEKGEMNGVLQMRKQLSFYASGYENAAALRRSVNETSSYCEMDKLLMEWYLTFRENCL